MFTPTCRLRAALCLTTAVGLALPPAANAQEATPPARVGQIANLSGNVSFNGAGSNGAWIAAAANYPVTTGDTVFTQAGGQAAVVVDASRLTLAENTELQITALDDENLTATESQGEVFVNVAALQQGQTFTLNTPQGAVQISQDGEYDVAVNNGGVTLSVLGGAATANGTPVQAGQAAEFSGNGAPSIGAVQQDGFINHVLAEMAPPPPPGVPPVVSQMTGAQELTAYGSWDQNPDYGAVWYPNVAPGWAPYHEGHWAYVAPWGWTWVEAEPWGFAPFHYGRWIDAGGRWGWVPAANFQPGVEITPVYAPAVVGFFGLGLAAGLSIAALSHGSIGWVPLAPGEPFHPYYHASPAYIERINRVDVRNYTVINNHITINDYANRRAAAYVPAEVMAHGEPVAHYSRPVGQADFARARPVEGNFSQQFRPEISHRPAAAPAYHPPAQEYHPQQMQQFHAQGGAETHPQAVQVYHPQAGAENHSQQMQQFHPQAAQTYHPQEMLQFHPQAGAENHPQAAQTYHPQEMQQFHPQGAQQFHPQGGQEIHPQEMPQMHAQPQNFRPQAPAPRNQAPRPQPPQPGHDHQG